MGQHRALPSHDPQQEQTGITIIPGQQQLDALEDTPQAGQKDDARSHDQRLGPCAADGELRSHAGWGF